MDSSPETKINFPPGFLLGAASAAHQVEGNNTHSDWWRAETAGKVPVSGAATDHYGRFEEDFQIAKDMGLNSIRISIEWARIEPVEGQWDLVEVEHYRKVLQSLKAKNLTRMVTLWHWTLPTWLADKGGFENKTTVEAFSRYALFIAENLGGEIDLWLTLNEPETYASLAFSIGKYPPFKKSIFSYLGVVRNLIRAHKRGFKTIKSVLPRAKIGIAKNLSYYEPYSKYNPIDQFLAFFANQIGNHYFFEKIVKQMDFIGMNYYFFNKIHFDMTHGYKEMNLNFTKAGQESLEPENRSDLGWYLYPKGIYHLALDLKRYDLPIYVTENGLADAADTRRPKFLRETMQWLSLAIREKADIRGYFHWALTDNYEWTEGFGPRFGLVEIDYATQKRTVRKSAEIFKQIN